MRTLITTAALLAALAVVFPAKAQTITIKADDCAQFVQHVAASDVAYKPGVDVHGRPVASADLDGGVRIELPEEYSIPITVDLQRKLGIPVDSDSFQTQNFTVGTVTWKDGKGYFNGQPLQTEESARLAALCQKRMATGR